MAKGLALGFLALGQLALAGCGSSSTGGDGGVDATAVEDSGPPGPACSDGCQVGESCYADGAVNPENPCQICDAARSTTAFSDNDGASCDDGLYCTVDDACVAGACGGAARTCDDGIACTAAATCDEDADACGASTSTCASGELCDAVSGDCVSECSGCSIDGICYGDGQIDPSSPCRVCRVSASRSAWSDNDGASCDDGEFCTTGDVCTAGTCAGAARDCDDSVSCNGAETCDETANACARGVTTCAAGEVCDTGADACVATCSGCVIGGTCYGAGQRNPSNQCEVCDPATSTSAFTANDGATCDDGLFCTVSDVCTGTSCGGAARGCADGIACNGAETCDEAAGACARGTSTCGTGLVCDPAVDACVTTCSGCVIDGTCYGAGQVNPANACLVCDVATSTTAWSDNDGARCDDGLFCTSGDVCAAGVCAGGARDCSDGVACNGAETCDETAGACAAGSTTCGATQVCDVSSDACVTTCSGCVIGGDCFADGTRDPANACQICDVTRSRSAFSANDGASCDDGLFCTVGDVCSGGLCAGSSATSFCDDGVACNGTETCNESTDRCEAGASTCAPGTSCDTMTDTCATSCGGGLSPCSGACVDTAHDPSHCGGCGNACSLTNVATTYCAGGSCGVADCVASYGDCDTVASNGCETNLGADSSNCGACGLACPGGEYCVAGACAAGHRVFVTSLIYGANMGGLAGADALCQARADAAGLGGTFRAWLSTGTVSASSRLTHPVAPIVLIDGTVVANDWADFTDGALAHAIDMTETGGAPPVPNPLVLSEPTVWTGSTAAGGTVSGTDQCVGWTSTDTSTSHTMTEGRTDRTTAAWSLSRTWSGAPCSWQRPLYCLEQ